MKKIILLLTVVIGSMCSGITNPLTREKENCILEHQIEINLGKLEELAKEKSIIESPHVQRVFNYKSERNKEALILGICDIGTGSLNSPEYTAIIRDKLIVELLVCALFDNDESVRDLAFNKLTTIVDRKLLPEHKDKIQQALSLHKFSNSLRLLCLTNPTSQEREQWLKKEHLSLSIRAALGDTVSEDTLIKQFNNANSFEKIHGLAEELAFVNSPKTIRALLKGLETDIFFENSTSKQSAIWPIIRAIGKIHPEKEELNREIVKIINFGDYRMGGEEYIRDYLNRVARWCESTYGIRPNIPKEKSFIFIPKGNIRFK